MAGVSAQFTADFTQFNAEAKKAERSLKLVEDQSEQLGQTGSKVAGVLGSTFGQAFAGFTAANLLANAVSTLSDLATEAFRTAEAMVDLSESTGQSLETVQRWSGVAQIAGEDVRLFADASSRLGTTLDEGSSRATAAIEDLGLSLADLRRAENPLDVVIDALGRMEDSQRRNTDAVILLGRESAKGILSVAGDYTRLKEQVSVATDEQIRALDEAQEVWKTWAATAKAAALSVAANVTLYLRDAFREITFGGKQAAKDIELVGDASNKAGPSVKELADALDAADRQAKKFAEANEAIVASMAGASGVSGAVQEAVKYYLELGVAQDKLATYYDVAPQAIAAIAEAMRQEEQVAKERQATMQKQIDATARLIETFKGPAGLNEATRVQVTEALRLGAAQGDIAAAFGVSSAAVRQLASDLEAATVKTKAMTDQTNQYVLENLKARQAIETARGGAAAATPYGTYEAAIAGLREQQAGPGGGVIDFAARQEALWLQLQDDLGKVTESTTAVTAAQTKQQDAVTTGTNSLHQFQGATQQAAQGFFAMSGQLHQSIVAAQQLQALAGADKGIYASGFGVSSSPTSRWMAAATMNSLMSPPIININGSVLGNKDEIARVVGDAVTSSYRSGGNRLPV